MIKVINGIGIQIAPCTAFWGGIITHEVIKITGMFNPIQQWLHYSFFEALPSQKNSK